eukprot:CAMPEP_0119336428 /NCGR_PEP_ID=MMETSP1333-20130426/91794_1 /TAXON_ID=418940 /ORGANISM="Scyphosphaera apsteinii, Strain RCC1455" /LENGTH=518 /DNA_ID=CAMNT_0007347229 /DNA_START=49 /DNA_END=1605 /DNA_ORIENTATION=-
MTADELRARISREQQIYRQNEEALKGADDEIEAAAERQRLRRQLERLQGLTAEQRGRLIERRNRRHGIDLDAYDYFCDEPKPARNPKLSVVRATISFNERKAMREFIWELGGLSWLPHTLEQEERECTESVSFNVDEDDDDSHYILVFSPSAGSLVHCDEDEYDEYVHFDEGTRGTLALIRKKAHFGTNLHVRFFVKSAESGAFTQWGDTTRVAVPAIPRMENARCFVLGPDVSTENKGVLGLSFDELLRSQWVANDTITFKVAIQEIVMQDHPEQGRFRVAYHDISSEPPPSPLPSVEVPPSTLVEDMLALLASGTHSDLTIEAAYGDVEPMRFTAHANVLSQRSAVFHAALAHGTSECSTRTIKVTDVPPLALKALLHFLYTDDCEQVERVLSEEGAGTSALAASEDASSVLRMAQLQAVLAVAHKYQVVRLLKWSELRLCELIDCETVCSLFGLAHMYQGTALEQCCLAFMHDKTAEVVTRPEFATLAPECLVKFNMHCAGVQPNDESKKRKRDA